MLKGLEGSSSRRGLFHTLTRVAPFPEYDCIHDYGCLFSKSAKEPRTRRQTEYQLRRAWRPGRAPSRGSSKGPSPSQQPEPSPDYKLLLLRVTNVAPFANSAGPHRVATDSTRRCSRSCGRQLHLRETSLLPMASLGLEEFGKMGRDKTPLCAYRPRGGCPCAIIGEGREPLSDVCEKYAFLRKSRRLLK